VRRHLLLERGQLNAVEPDEQLVDGELADFGDAATGDADTQRFRLELGAVTIRAFLRGLILAQEDADVLLVLLPPRDPRGKERSLCSREPSI
jgi:hypothetical protein